MLLAGLATYFNVGASVARQSPEAAANPQAAIMNKLALWCFRSACRRRSFPSARDPAVLVLEQHLDVRSAALVFGKIEKEEEPKKQEVIQRRAANAPAPGAKPKRAPKAAPTGGSGADTAVADDGTEHGDAVDGDGKVADTDGQSAADRAAKTPVSKADKTTPPGRTNGPNNRAPRPGARPKRRKR